MTFSSTPTLNVPLSHSLYSEKMAVEQFPETSRNRDSRVTLSAEEEVEQEEEEEEEE